MHERASLRPDNNYGFCNTLGARQDSLATSAGRATFLHPIALAVGLKAQYDSATSGGACAVAERR